MGARRLEGAPQARFGRPRRVLDVTGSTNDDALAWAQREAPEGALVVAGHQTAGRGRWGRRWESVPGAGLLFSLVLRPQRPVAEIGLVTTALGVAVAEGVESVCGLECRLKWPNDVTVAGRKLAGVLVETRLVGSTVTVAVAGVGINVDWAAPPPELADRATSVAAELRRTGRPADVDRGALLAAVLDRFEHLYPSAIHAPDTVLRRATRRSEVLGRAVQIRRADGSALAGTATRLLATGELEVRAGGHSVTVEAGEIERVRAQ
jgi:BirA family transcriptional regulator, biotin operon repressor / biotin---[acetyl-CoA-carboxylase] ligase